MVISFVIRGIEYDCYAERDEFDMLVHCAVERADGKPMTLNEIVEARREAIKLIEA